VPQGRGKIERFSDTITTELLPGPPGHLAAGGATLATPPRLSLAELDAAIGRFVVDDYHARVHSETWQAPRERWLAGGWLPRMPDSLEINGLTTITRAVIQTEREGLVIGRP
jgi:putative transposase